MKDAGGIPGMRCASSTLHRLLLRHHIGAERTFKPLRRSLVRHRNSLTLAKPHFHAPRPACRLAMHGLRGRIQELA